MNLIFLSPEWETPKPGPLLEPIWPVSHNYLQTGQEVLKKKNTICLDLKWKILTVTTCAAGNTEKSYLPNHDLDILLLTDQEAEEKRGHT